MLALVVGAVGCARIGASSSEADQPTIGAGQTISAAIPADGEWHALPVCAGDGQRWVVESAGPCGAGTLEGRLWMRGAAGDGVLRVGRPFSITRGGAFELRAGPDLAAPCGSPLPVRIHCLE